MALSLVDQVRNFIQPGITFEPGWSNHPHCHNTPAPWGSLNMVQEENKVRAKIAELLAPYLAQSHQKCGVIHSLYNNQSYTEIHVMKGFHQPETLFSFLLGDKRKTIHLTIKLHKQGKAQDYYTVHMYITDNFQLAAMTIQNSSGNIVS